MTFKSKGIVVLKRPFPSRWAREGSCSGLKLIFPWLLWKDSMDGGVEGLYYRSCQKVITYCCNKKCPQAVAMPLPLGIQSCTWTIGHWRARPCLHFVLLSGGRGDWSLWALLLKVLILVWNRASPMQGSDGKAGSHGCHCKQQWFLPADELGGVKN